jgi:hypothetical protein
VTAVLARVVAACCAVSWLTFPGFGVPDLAVTWDPRWRVVLEAGWGLFATVLAAAGFAQVAVRPRRCAPALAQLAVATGALAVSAAAGREPGAASLAGLLAAETAAVAALARPGGWRLRPEVDAPLAFLAVAGAVPWTAYALRMWQATRAGTPADITVGVDHAAVQGALALCLAVQVPLAAVWPGGRRPLGTAAGLAAAYLGLVCLARPDEAGGVGLPWSVPATAWGVAVAALALRGAGGPRSGQAAVSRARTSSGHGVERPSDRQT